MTFVHADASAEPCMVLTEAVKGGAPALRVSPPLLLYEPIDQPSKNRKLTEKAEEICTALGEEFGSSGTKIGAKGSYTGDDKTIVYFVLNRFQIGKMKKIVHEVDEKAYITISEVADVFKSNI